MSVPDYALEETIDFKFTTRAFATGIPTVLAGTPVIEVYEDNSVTQITAGETLTVDFDAIVGLNNLRIVATAANGYEAGKSYAAVISTGTVGGVSVVGEVVAQFSLQRSPVNWANVTAPTTAVDLSGTDIQLCDTITTYTGNTKQTADHTAGIADIKTITDQFVFTVANQIDSNTLAISGDVTAADNLELMYDGTGYTDQTAPSSRAQVDSIGASSGGALNFANEADNVDTPIKSITFDGVETSGTNASVNAEDATYHQIDDITNNIDIVYQFDIGGGRTGVDVIWKGRLTGTNDTFTIQVFNGSTWDTITSITGQSNSAPTSVADNSIHTIPLLSTHTGVGADLGKVFIRLECVAQSNPTLYTDQLLVSAVSIGQTIGYANGQVWVNTINGVAGTAAYVNGVADNAVLTWADALTISAVVSDSDDYHIINGSTIALTANSDNHSLFGDNWILQLESQSISNSYFQGATVSGISTATTECHFEGCDFGTASLQLAHIDKAGFSGIVTFTLAGDYNIHDSYSKGDTSPVFTKTAGQVIVVEFQNYAGDITVNGIQAGDTIELGGFFRTVTLAGTGGTVHIHGHYETVLSGSFSGTLAVTGAIKTADVAAILVDTGTTLDTKINDIQGVTFNSASDSLEAIRNRGDVAWDTATGFSTHTAANVRTEMDSNSTQFTAIVADTNELQLTLSAGILARSNNATLETLLGVDDDAAADTLVFQVWEEVLIGATHNVINSSGKRLRAVADTIIRDGIAQAGSATTITLDATASVINQFYRFTRIQIVEGTGIGQVKVIIDYIGSTKVATVSGTWITNPDATSVFEITAAVTHATGTNQDAIQGYVVSSTASTLVIDGNASTINDFYNDNVVLIHTGTGSGQSRTVKNYIGATKTITLDMNWITNPDTTSEYVIVATGNDWEHQLTNHNVAGTFGAAVNSILDDTGTTGVAISTTVQQAIADEILKRNISNVEATAPEHSLATMVLAGLESSISGTTWTIKRTNGTTTHATKTVTVNAAADPITGVT